jgi:hypothetical protein
MRLTPRQRHSALAALEERRRILEFNERKRRERSTNALPDQSGRVQWSMHSTDYWASVLRYPELRLGDGQQRHKAWQKFLNTEEGAKFKINPHEGKRVATPKGIIIR